MTDASAKPLAPGLIARVAAGLRYIAGGDPPDWFGPLDPMPPMAPPAIAGRSFDFPVGVNLRIQPRPDEPISFAELRALADRYDLLRLVIETRKDQLEKFQWSIRKRAGTGDIDGDGDPRIAAIEDLLRYPDREHDFGTWLRLLLEDLLVIDAPTLYVRRDAGGAVHSLEVVDGATIKRVIDERGRTPLPPSPAYQQVLKGLPAIDYSTDELIYRPRNPRPHKIYGFSPVEQVVMTVNIALRRQVAQLQYYTEGNVPEAMIGVPESWSPDQIRQFQDYWDALLEGNTAARRHAKFVPGGMRPTFTREPMLKDEYDEWLARVVCFAFSVAPTPFVRDSNRATAQTTQQAALAEGLSPLLRWVKGLLDEVIHRHLGYADLEFAWAESKDQDPAQQAEIDDTYVRAGIKSVDEVRAELGLDAVGFGNAIYTGAGAVPLKDVAAQAAASPAAKHALAKYDPDQPRAPAGSSAGGQWTSGGGGAAADADASGNDLGASDTGGHDDDSRDTGAMVAAADNVGTMSDADAPAVPPQVAQGGDDEYSWQHPSPEEQHRREQAAVEAVAADIAKLPDANKVFYRGFIYHDADYRYFATDPVPGNSFGPDVTYPADTGVPKGTNTVTAIYYSHPNNLFTGGSTFGDPLGDAQRITGQQQIFGQAHGLDVYVRTSSGNVLYWQHQPLQ